MRCPKCRESTQVLDSRPDKKSVNRRRKCIKCEHRFSTIERLAEAPRKRKPASRLATGNKFKSTISKSDTYDRQEMWSEDLTDDELEAMIYSGGGNGESI
jgi:transcriptional regulator NrdR family protein